MSSHSFFTITPHSIRELADKIGAGVAFSSGEADTSGITISAAAPLEDALPGSVAFIDNRKYAKHLATTKASAVICEQRYVADLPPGTAGLVHDQPYRAYAAALDLIYPTAAKPAPVTGETGVSPKAHIGDGVELEDDVIVEPGAVIGRGAAIGSGSRILANAVIGENVQIGRNSVIGVSASVTHAYIGDGVIIHAGVRIGQDGFGFAMGPQGHRKVAQIGRVIIQDKVEIGANSTIDRGSNRDTVIGEGSKIDNLVQIGHNVMIGRHCIVVGLAGIAGSATLGDYVVIAGQVGIGGHTTVGTGAQVGGGAGTHTDIAAGEKVIGYPAMPVKDWVAGEKVIGYPAMPVKDWVRLNMKLKAMISGKGISDKAKKQD